MTFTFKEEKVSNYLLCIEQDKFQSTYHVLAYPKEFEGMYGHPITDIVYPTMEKAKRRYSYLKRKAMKGKL